MFADTNLLLFSFSPFLGRRSPPQGLVLFGPYRHKHIEWFGWVGRGHVCDSVVGGCDGVCSVEVFGREGGGVEFQFLGVGRSVGGGMEGTRRGRGFDVGG